MHPCYLMRMIPNITPIRIAPRTARWTIALPLFLVMVWLKSPNPALAHPIEFHMRPLDTQTVERVIVSLNRMLDTVEAAGDRRAISWPEKPMGIADLVPSLQDALMDVDEVTTLESPSLRQALRDAGYPDAPFIVEEWELDARQLLETYEVLSRGLDFQQVQAGYAAFDKARPLLTDDQTLDRESHLMRDHELVRTTGKDLELVSRYVPRLKALLQRAGIGANRP